MLRQRLITGSILIGSFLGLVWLDDQCTIRDGGGVVFAALFAILIPLAAAEAARLGRDCGIRTPTGLTVIVALTMFLAGVTSLLVSDPTLAAGLAMLGPAAGFAIASIGLAATRRIEGAFMGAATIAGIAIWTGLLPVFWLSAFRDHGAWLVAGLVLVVKSGDIGAYFTGMAVGRHKLIPWLSPKKTIEGGIGALLFGGLAGAGLQQTTGKDGRRRTTGKYVAFDDRGCGRGSLARIRRRTRRPPREPFEASRGCQGQRIYRSGDGWDSGCPRLSIGRRTGRLADTSTRNRRLIPYEAGRLVATNRIHRECWRDGCYHRRDDPHRRPHVLVSSG